MRLRAALTGSSIWKPVPREPARDREAVEHVVGEHLGQRGHDVGGQAQRQGGRTSTGLPKVIRLVRSPRDRR